MKYFVNGLAYQTYFDVHDAVQHFYYISKIADVILGICVDGQDVTLFESKSNTTVFPINNGYSTIVLEIVKAMEMEKEIENALNEKNKREQLLSNLCISAQIGPDSSVYQSLSSLLGMGKTQCKDSFQSSFGEIDHSLADLLIYLNEQGYHTLASCSGLATEHTFSKNQQGYIAFDLREEKNQQLLQELIKSDFNILISHCYFIPSFKITWRGKKEYLLLIDTIMSSPIIKHYAIIPKENIE